MLTALSLTVRCLRVDRRLLAFCGLVLVLCVQRWLAISHDRSKLDDHLDAVRRLAALNPGHHDVILADSKDCLLYTSDAADE